MLLDITLPPQPPLSVTLLLRGWRTRGARCLGNQSRMQFKATGSRLRVKFCRDHATKEQMSSNLHLLVLVSPDAAGETE